MGPKAWELVLDTRRDLLNKLKDIEHALWAIAVICGLGWVTVVALVSRYVFRGGLG